MKKILFYTSNGFSLGHLQRSYQISQAFKNEKVEIGLITSSLKPDIFGRFFSQSFKIKPLTDELLKDPYQEARLENTDVVLGVFEKFKPDLVIADFLLESDFTFYPLKKALDKFKTKSIFVWRLGEIKNLAHDLNKEKDKLKYFSKIILPYDKGELPILKDSKFVIVGPVFRKIDEEKLNISREKYGINPKDFLITITLGGGGQLKAGNCESSSKILKHFLEIYPQLKQIIPNLKVVISTGPYYNKKITKIKGIKIVNFEKNLLELIHLSELVISPAGYNTCYEILEAKTPALLVPLWRKSKEQFERALDLENKGIARVWQGKTKESFLETILGLYKDLDKIKSNFKKLPRIESGNKKIAREILKLC